MDSPSDLRGPSPSCRRCSAPTRHPQVLWCEACREKNAAEKIAEQRAGRGLLAKLEKLKSEAELLAPSTYATLVQQALNTAIIHEHQRREDQNLAPSRETS